MADHLLDLPVPCLPAIRSVALARAGLEKLALTTTELTRASQKVDPNPSSAQKEVGNYKKGHISWKGLRITIETAKGHYRSGVGKDGKPWKTLMKAHYGYLKGSEGKDGDQVDIFLGDDLESEIVFVVNQVKPGTKAFDEHKVVLGVTSEEAAKKLYLSCYQDSWTGLGSITPMTLDQFKWWLEHADTRKEIKDGFWAHSKLRKAAGYDEEKVDKARAVVEKCRKEKRDLDGIYVHVNPVISLAWVDVMDWGDSETGSVLEMRLKRLFQDVLMRNEAAKPRGPGWVQLYPEPYPKKASAPMALRPLTEQDIPRLVEIEKNSFPDDPYDEATFRKNLQTMTGVGAQEGDTLTGYMIHRPVESRPGYHYVQSIAVHPEHRRKGIGTALLQHLRNQGDITLDVRANNKPALALYDKMGFGRETSFMSKGHGLAHHLSTSAQIKSGFEISLPSLLLIKRARDNDSPFTIAVDLDGTIAEKQSPFDPEDIGEPRERAVYWLRLFHAAGARIIIFTVRGNTTLVKKWLKDNEVPFDYVNENPDQPPDSSGKVWADCYWDDKAYNAEDPDEFGPEILHRATRHGKGKEKEKKKPGSVHVSLMKSTTIIMAAPDILDALETA